MLSQQRNVTGLNTHIQYHDLCCYMETNQSRQTDCPL